MCVEFSHEAQKSALQATHRHDAAAQDPFNQPDADLENKAAAEDAASEDRPAKKGKRSNANHDNAANRQFQVPCSVFSLISHQAPSLITKTDAGVNCLSSAA